MKSIDVARGFCAFVLVTAFSVALPTRIARAGTVYTIDTTIVSSDPTGNPLQSNTVVGTITTDGTIGVLTPSDILSWNLDLIDNLNSADDFDLTTSNSSLVEDMGGALSATASGLYFNYSGSGEFLIQANSPGAYSGYHYFCFSTGLFACLAGETVAPDYIFTDGTVLTGASAPVGTQPLNQLPEPATGVLFGCLTVLGGALRRRFVP